MSTPADANPAPAIRTTISRPVIKQCPHRAETDAGTLTITFEGEAPELHHLADLVDDLSARLITHETFTQEIAALLRQRSAQPATVVTEWHTGPWSVTVATV